MYSYLRSKHTDQIQINFKRTNYNEVTHRCVINWGYRGLIWGLLIWEERRFNESCFGSFHILIYMGGEKMCKSSEITTIVKRHYVSFVLSCTKKTNSPCYYMQMNFKVLKSLYTLIEVYTEGNLENRDGSKIKLLREKILSVFITKKW